MNANDFRAQITRHGDARRAARATAREHLDAIVKLAPAAMAAGVKKKEIAERGQISRTTLDDELARH